MTSEFELVNLGALAKLRSGYSFKGTDWAESGTPVIKIANVKAGRIVPVGCAFVDDATTLAASAWLTQPDDVLMAMTGYVGEVARVRRGERYLINQRVGRFDDVVCSRVTKPYLYYVLQHPEIRATIEQIARGSAQANLSAGDAHKIQVPLPPLSIQNKISEVLTALDDRITLLRETNATLEAIAQALFKSWFVDFDPVRAKQEGRAPDGMGEATAALFPDSFEEAELGLVPRGWRVAPVGEVVETVGGGTPDTKDESYWQPAEFCWTTPKDLSAIHSPVLLDTERKLSAKGVAKISSGLLPAGTLLMSSRAPIGYLAIAQVPMAINQGYIAMLPGGKLPPLYLLYWCRQNMETIKNHANGSTFMEISKKAFRPLLALVPPPELVAEFSALAEALFGRVVENERQAQTLATLRDTLLPRLISGQLRLPEAEALIEEIAP